MGVIQFKQWSGITDDADPPKNFLLGWAGTVAGGDTIADGVLAFYGKGKPISQLDGSTEFSHRMPTGIGGKLTSS